MIDEKKIAEAASAHLNDARADYGVREVGVYSYPADLRDIEEQIKEDFTDGAHWAIGEFKKSLWHDASEEPKKGELCLVYGRYVYEGVSRMDYVPYTWLEDCDYVPQGDNYTIIRWCYLSDILLKEGGEK